MSTPTILENTEPKKIYQTNLFDTDDLSCRVPPALVYTEQLKRHVGYANSANIDLSMIFAKTVTLKLLDGCNDMKQVT